MGSTREHRATTPVAPTIGTPSPTPRPPQGGATPPPGSIAPGEATRVAGRRATVCGLVVDSHYAGESEGKPTFLNFGRPYPDQTFTVVIWEDARPRFPPTPERYYRGRRVCATGIVRLYEGDPEMVVRAADQLRVVR